MNPNYNGDNSDYAKAGRENEPEVPEPKEVPMTEKKAEMSEVLKEYHNRMTVLDGYERRGIDSTKDKQMAKIRVRAQLNRHYYNLFCDILREEQFAVDSIGKSILIKKLAQAIPGRKEGADEEAK